jgi:hypothetical protein
MSTPRKALQDGGGATLLRIRATVKFACPVIGYWGIGLIFHQDESGGTLDGAKGVGDTFHTTGKTTSAVRQPHSTQTLQMLILKESSLVYS